MILLQLWASSNTADSQQHLGVHLTQYMTKKKKKDAVGWASSFIKPQLQGFKLLLLARSKGEWVPSRSPQGFPKPCCPVRLDLNSPPEVYRETGATWELLG